MHFGSMMRRASVVLACTLALAAFAPNAGADTITPSLVSVAPNGSGGFTWTYTVTLASGFSLDPGKTWTSTPDGHFFTLYDFGGYIAASETFAPAAGTGTWTSVVSASGLTPLNTAPTDTGLPNVSFVWNADVAEVGNALSPTFLGTFTIDSLYAGQALGVATSQDTDINNPDIRNASVIDVRVAQVPEPSSLLLLGAGLVALALRRGRA